MGNRKAIGKRLRFEIFKRDGFICQYCGRHPPAVVLEPDHINPVINGGDNSIDNLVTACFDCNRGKAGVLLSSIPTPLADKADEVREREAQLLGYYEIMESRRLRIEDEIWRIIHVFMPNTKEIRRDWFNGIKLFIEKLGFHEVLDAMDISVGKGFRQHKQDFAYFCGICWRKIRNLNEH